MFCLNGDGNGLGEHLVLGSEKAELLDLGAIGQSCKLGCHDSVFEPRGRRVPEMIVLTSRRTNRIKDVWTES